MLLLIASLTAAAAEPASCAASIPRSSALAQEVRRARSAMTRSINTGDAASRQKLLASDVLLMPEFQPTLRGRGQVASYDRAARERYGLVRATVRVLEVLDLGGTALERGEFSLDRNGARRGKYLAVWGRGPSGAVELRAETSSYVHPVANGDAEVLVNTAGTVVPDAGTPELRRMNDRMEQAVRRRDAQARTAFFAPGAVFMPVGQAAKVGLPEIRQHLIAYNSGDAVVENVRVWTERQQDLGPYLIEYSRSEARWRSGEASGEHSGKGIRLWWRAPGGELKLCREGGSHDAPAAIARGQIRLHEGNTPAPHAALADLDWLKGSWIGRMPSGPVEHIILDKSFGHMPGFVRALNEKGLSFYEITVFAEAEGSLAYRVKHFTPQLAGWEPQDAYIDRPLVERRGDTFYFDGITFSRRGPDSFTVYYLPRDGGKEGETLVIPFRRK